MRRHVSLLCVLLLIATVAGPAVPLLEPEPAAAAVAAPSIKVAVVKSETSLKASDPIPGTSKTPDGSKRVYNEARVQRVYDLLRAQQGMEVSIIGDAELSDVAQLRKYDTVVLVRNVATVQAHRLALRQYAAEGGGVVSMFSTSRYDYRPGQKNYQVPSGYSSYGTPFFQFNFDWGFSGSSLLSQSWEYAEISELIATKFCNDPLFQPNYDLRSSGAAHPILQWTAADRGTTVSGISFRDPLPQYNETVWPTKGAPVTTLLNYSNERVGDRKVGIESATTRYGAASHMAAWALPYYYGKVVAFGFQIYDLVGDPTAARFVVNSVKWAGTHDTFGDIRKSPDVSVTAWYSGGQIWATAGVSNKGSIQLRGRLRADYYRPGATTPFAGCWIKDPNGYVPVAPGESYKDTAQGKPSVSPSKGRWRVRVSYSYYDYFRKGWVSVYRDGNLDGTGSGMIWRGQGGLVAPTATLNAPTGSSQLAGSDRYATSVAVSKAGWTTVDETSNAVILASGQNFIDALAAAPLAGKKNAPVLLAHPTYPLSSAVKAELERLYASSDETATLYVASGLAESVVEDAKEAIAEAGEGTRAVETTLLAGAERIATGRNVALAAGPSDVPGYGDTAFIVTGAGYADALSIAPVAARLKVPVVFTSADPNAQVPAPAAQEALAALGTKHAVILGSTAAVSAGIEDWLERNGYRDPADARLQGPNRYETCLRVLDYAKARGFADDALYVATGNNYPDALAIAPLAGMRGKPVLLVHGSDIARSAPSAAYLSRMREIAPPVTFAGGTPTLTPYLRGQIKAALTP